MSIPVYIRLYGDLNDFLPPSKRHKTFCYHIKGKPSVKDTLEAIGVPHIEVDAVLSNGVNISWNYCLQEPQKISAYPLGWPRLPAGRHLIPALPSPARFIADVHLGKLSRYLRLLGFDTLYDRQWHDREIAHLAVGERRIVLSRDIGLLKRGSLVWGRWLRSTTPFQQTREVLKYFDLYRQSRPFRYCLECNGRLFPVPKRDILPQIPAGVATYQNRFRQCFGCGRIYWPGTHHNKLDRMVRKLLGIARK